MQSVFAKKIDMTAAISGPGGQIVFFANSSRITASFSSNQSLFFLLVNPIISSDV